MVYLGIAPLPVLSFEDCLKELAGRIVKSDMFRSVELKTDRDIIDVSSG